MTAPSPRPRAGLAATAEAAAAPLATVLFAFAFGGQALRNLLGWPLYGALAVALVLVVLGEAWRRRDAVVGARPPLALAGFLGVSALSLLWSQYQWTSLLGLAAQWATAAAGLLVAATVPWRGVVRSLGDALRLLLASSLAFEVVIAVVVGRPLAPAYLDLDSSAPGAYFWSENHLLELGPIQGVVGNRNLLAFIALLSLILTVSALIERSRLTRADIGWVAAALVALALTRSATVILAAVAAALVALLLVVVRRTPARSRAAVSAAGWGLLGIAVSACIASADAVLALLGRGDMTGRTAIWRTVAWLAEQQPFLGWGWVGYWPPWVPPYRGLVVIDGVEYLQAHNALLDIWLQLGLVGVVVALLVAASTAVGVWRWATGPAAESTPLLLLVALLFQSLTESRLLIEGNWLLLVVICCTVAGRGADRDRRAAERRAIGQQSDLLRSMHDLGTSLAQRIRRRGSVHAVRR